MKCKILLILVVIITLIVSCKSPDLPSEAETNSNVDIKINHKSFKLGDTLRLNIHINNSIYPNGMIDFKDGTKIYFYSMKPIVDTSISHIYKNTGNYNILVEFHKNEISENKEININVLPRHFNLSFSTGTIWTFNYNYEYYDPPRGYQLQQKGIHVWKIISSEISTKDTIYKVQQIRNDLKNEGYTSNSVNDTLLFNIISSPSSVKINWPLYSGIKEYTIPNHSSVSTYPIVVEYSEYNDIAGPLKYYYNWYTIHSTSIKEELTLIDFKKP